MATYYWVGGNGTWNGSSTTNWSLTSGGLGGLGPPNSTDTVIFDSASGTGTCTTAAGSACSVATLNSATLGLTLGADHTMSGAFNLTAGTLTLGSNKLTALQFVSSNTNTRTIAFGTGNITLTGNNIAVVNFGNNAGLTVTGTPVMNLNYSGSTGTRTITYGTASGSEARAIQMAVTAGTDIVTVTSGSNIKGIIFTGFSGTFSNSQINCYGDVTFSSGMTLTAGANSLDFKATSTQNLTTAVKTLDFPMSLTGIGGSLVLQDSCTMGSTRTFTHQYGTFNLNGNSFNCGFFASNYSTSRTVAFGSSSFSVTGNAATVWNVATLTNWSYTGTSNVNATYSGSTGTRTINHGLLGGGAESNAVNFNITAGSDVFTTNSTAYVKNLNFTGFSGTFNNTSLFVYGNLTVSSGMTLNAGANVTTFAATSGTQQITTNAKTLDFPITFNGVGGTFAFQDALTQGSTRAFTITNGTVQLKAGVTSTVGSFVANSATMKYLQSTLAGTQATLSQASGTVNASNLTIKDINATGGATWNAYYINGDINAGNNTGWDFLVQLGRYIYSRRKNKVILN